MTDSLEKINELVNSMDARLHAIENSILLQESARVRSSEHFSPPINSHVASSTPPLDFPGAASNRPDLQGDFQAIRDSVSRVKIPSHL